MSFSTLKSHYSKFYKAANYGYISNLRIVSMIPGDLVVAGCFNFSRKSGVSLL